MAAALALSPQSRPAQIGYRQLCPPVVSSAGYRILPASTAWRRAMSLGYPMTSEVDGCADPPVRVVVVFELLARFAPSPADAIR